MKTPKIDNLIDSNNLKNIGTMAGIITTVVVAFYVTGLVLNLKGIKKINAELKSIENNKSK
jgi:hypothetical protein